MKRYFLLPILFAVILSLSACGEPPTVQSDFSSAFTASRDNIDYTGTVVKDGTSLTVTLSEPCTVDGMAFCWDDDALSIRYAGHSANANADYLPADSIPAALHYSLAYLPQASYTETANGTDHFKLPTPYGDASLTAVDGVPTTLTDPLSETVFHFG